MDEALMKAMNLFWRQGYAATSIADLVACMGIGRGSLYNEFGDKHGLFVRALRLYDEVWRERWVAEFVKSSTPRRAILDVFEAARRGGPGGGLARRLPADQHRPGTVAARSRGGGDRPENKNPAKSLT